jgi:hypothetical protein
VKRFIVFLPFPKARRHVTEEPPFEGVKSPMLGLPTLLVNMNSVG